MSTESCYAGDVNYHSVHWPAVKTGIPFIWCPTLFSYSIWYHLCFQDMSFSSPSFMLIFKYILLRSSSEGASPSILFSPLLFCKIMRFTHVCYILSPYFHSYYIFFHVLVFPNPPPLFKYISSAFSAHTHTHTHTVQGRKMSLIWKWHNIWNFSSKIFLVLLWYLCKARNLGR